MYFNCFIGSECVSSQCSRMLVCGHQLQRALVRSRAETGLAQNLNKKVLSTGCTLIILDWHIFLVLRLELYSVLVRSRGMEL